MYFCESVVVDECLDICGSVGKRYAVVYYEDKAMFFWFDVHAECSVVMERSEVLSWGKVCFLYGGDVYIMF